jgi:hypothetical protein
MSICVLILKKNPAGRLHYIWNLTFIWGRLTMQIILAHKVTGHMEMQMLWKHMTTIK